MMTDLQAAGPQDRRQPRAAVTGFAIALAGSAVLGLPAGLLWGEVAPRALFQEIGAGTAELVNAETHAFIGADAWFCGIAAVAGLLTGVLGYRLLVARRAAAARAAAAAGLILGALAGALVMLWLGERIGLSGYDQALASSRNGTMFRASLGLGAKSALAFWPLVTSVVILIAEWSGHRDEQQVPPPPATPGPFGYPQPPGVGYGQPQG
jgi:hypothetical protein